MPQGSSTLTLPGACLLLFAIFIRQASRSRAWQGCATLVTLVSQSGLGLEIKNLFVYLLMVPGCATVAAACQMKHKQYPVLYTK